MIESVQFSGYTPLLNISLNNLTKRSSTTSEAFLNISPKRQGERQREEERGRE